MQWPKKETATLLELARRPGLKTKDVCLILNRNKNSVRSGYNINYKFFECHSPELWYFLGFFYADGAITKDHVGFWLNALEKPFLDILLSWFTDARSKVYSNRCVWSTTCNELRYELMSFGLTRRKLLTIRVPSIPNEHTPDFIRGYFDGDGCASLRKKDNWLTVEIFSGSKLFLIDIEKILERINIGCKLRRENQSANVWRLKIKARSIKRFAKYIYYNEEVFCLNRKRNKILNHKTHNDFFGIARVAEELGVNLNSLYGWRKRFGFPYSYLSGKRKYYSRQDVNKCQQILEVQNVLGV